MVGEYDYFFLYEEFARTHSSADLERLLEWFQRYGALYWNGEYFDADEYKVFPDCTAQLK